jgi:RimJ/RimL family protein N-acetyltransferase
MRVTQLTDKLGQPFVLRMLLPDDYRGLIAMYEAFEPKRAAQGLPPGSREQIVRWLAGTLAAGIHVVVEVEGEILGHGMLLPYQPGAAELANFLHQSIRDRGIGTALNRQLLDAGREQGLRRAWLSVEPSNRRAIRAYEKVGFRRRSISLWSPEIEMELELQDPAPEDGDGR